jgi:hypothetical protein
MTTVNINLIRLDGGTQCRTVIDQSTVYTYLERIKEGEEFPLMETIFDGKTYWLVDGFHRYHAFKLADVQEIEINSKQGTLQDAQIEALKANSKHGKQLTNDDKRNKVEMALKIEGFEKKSNYEIAKICELSASFVASVRNPEAKKKQDEAKLKYAKECAKKFEDSSPTITEVETNTDLIRSEIASQPDSGIAPDDEEMKATELAMQADQETMYKMLEADDALAELYEENKKLNLLNAQLQVRIHGLMNEKNEAVKMIKDLQKQIDRHRKMARADSPTRTETRLDAEIASRNLNNLNPSNADGSFMS